MTALEPKSAHVYDLLSDHAQIEKNEKLQKTLEKVKERFGDQKLAIGAAKMPDRTWTMSQQHLSQNYFSWDGLLKIDH